MNVNNLKYNKIEIDNNNVNESISNLYAENEQLAFRLKNAEDNITMMRNYLERHSTYMIEFEQNVKNNFEHLNNVIYTNNTTTNSNTTNNSNTTTNTNTNTNNTTNNSTNTNTTNSNTSSNANNINFNKSKSVMKSLSISMNFSKDYRNIIFNVIKVLNIKRAFECAIDIAQQNLNGNGKNNAIIAGSNVAYACITYMCNPCKCNIDVVINTFSNNNEVNIDISVNTFIDMEILKAIKNAIYEAIVFKLNE